MEVCLPLPLFSDPSSLVIGADSYPATPAPTSSPTSPTTCLPAPAPAEAPNTKSWSGSQPSAAQAPSPHPAQQSLLLPLEAYPGNSTVVLMVLPQCTALLPAASKPLTRVICLRFSSIWSSMRALVRVNICCLCRLVRSLLRDRGLSYTQLIVLLWIKSPSNCFCFAIAVRVALHLLHICHKRTSEI